MGRHPALEQQYVRWLAVPAEVRRVWHGRGLTRPPSLRQLELVDNLWPIPGASSAAAAILVAHAPERGSSTFRLWGRLLEVRRLLLRGFHDAISRLLEGMRRSGPAQRHAGRILDHPLPAFGQLVRSTRRRSARAGPILALTPAPGFNRAELEAGLALLG